MTPPTRRTRPSLTATITVPPSRMGAYRRGERPPEQRVVSWEGMPETPLIELLSSSRPGIDYFRDRTDGLIHVSDIIGKCARQIALIEKLNTPHAPRPIPDNLAITFRQGDAIAKFVRNKLIDNHPDKVYAVWSCRCGKVETAPMLFRTSQAEEHRCDTCGDLPSQHNEVAIPDREWGVVGSPDLLMLVVNGSLYLTEIKSINRAQFEEMDRAQPDHIIQGLFYWSLMERAGYRIVDRFSVLYVQKEFLWKQRLPYREFVLPATPIMLKRLEPFTRDLLRIKACREDPKAPLPSRIVCGSMDAPDAKNCPVCVSCFQLPTDADAGTRNRS